MEKKQDPASGQEQNYDYIFEELDRQEQLRAGKPVITYPDGETEVASAPKTGISCLPAILILAAFQLILLSSAINQMLSSFFFGLTLMGISIWMSYAGDKKFQLQPLMILVSIIGFAIAYAATATLIYEASPFFDMELFKTRSVLGFGIGIAACGVALILSDIIVFTSRNTQVLATCLAIKIIGRINGRPYGNVIWKYEWEGVSYTSTSYNTIIGTLCDGSTDVIFINPANPGRIRTRRKTSSWTWGVVFLFIGSVLCWYYTALV
ncbi:MAG: hypothetical protein IKK51_09400 [Oscillospiraceae bacterium]|nr:hypothetical protein [Oscillospiraceae bacterium]